MSPCGVQYKQQYSSKTQTKLRRRCSYDQSQAISKSCARFRHSTPRQPIPFAVKSWRNRGEMTTRPACGIHKKLGSTRREHVDMHGGSKEGVRSKAHLGLWCVEIWLNDLSRRPAENERRSQSGSTQVRRRRLPILHIPKPIGACAIAAGSGEPDFEQR